MLQSSSSLEGTAHQYISNINCWVIDIMTIGSHRPPHGYEQSGDPFRVLNGLGIMRTCLETASLERIENRLDQLEETPPSYGNTQRDRPAVTAH
jgi:hypothetical protein